MFRLFYQLTTIQLHVTSAIKWCISLQIIESCELMKLSPKNIGMKMEISYIFLTCQSFLELFINHCFAPLTILGAHLYHNKNQ